MGDPAGERRNARRDALAVLGLALAVRVLVAVLTANSYDPDEFVILSLSRAFAHGAVPYRDFTFFHPPAILLLFRGLQPLVSLWWPAARLVVTLTDVVTCLVVWKLGRLLYGQREALAAGALYAVSPIAVLSSVRVEQDTVITALGMVGLLALLASRRHVAGPLAGLCLGLAIWCKYPAILFLPIYGLAAPRRAAIAALSAIATLAIAVLPFRSDLHALLTDTVTWQIVLRPHANPLQRWGALAVFWLLLNPLATLAGWCGRGPLWVGVGFGVGLAFTFSAQVYYHYLALVVPFAALLAAPLAVRVARRAPGRIAIAGLAMPLLCAGAMNLGIASSGFGAQRLSSTNAAVRVLRHATDRDDAILSDQFEYPYLAGRPEATDYFWDMQGVVSARSLERHLTQTTVVVVTANQFYPPGFVGYVARHGYRRMRAGDATLWLPRHVGRMVPEAVLVSATRR